jgi:hypothetical protein
MLWMGSRDKKEPLTLWLYLPAVRNWGAWSLRTTDLKTCHLLSHQPTCQWRVLRRCGVWIHNTPETDSEMATLPSFFECSECQQCVFYSSICFWIFREKVEHYSLVQMNQDHLGLCMFKNDFMKLSLTPPGSHHPPFGWKEMTVNLEDRELCDWWSPTYLTHRKCIKPANRSLTAQ